jgi:iron complex outermembrane receptor protein
MQDEITLRPDRLRLTLGVKIERNGYSGVEIQPSARLMWTPRAGEGAFLAVTRAVRTPSRDEQDFERTALLNPSVPQFLRLVPNDDFTSEKLVAYEAGYRLRPALPLYVSAAAFVHHVTDILSTEPKEPFVETIPPPSRLILPIVFANGLHGNTHGLEVTADLRPAPWLRWSGGWSWLRVQLTRDADSRDLSQELRGEALSPRHQMQSHVAADLGNRWEADWLLRYVGALPGAVPAYATSDVRIGLHLRPDVELSVIGRNLHEGSHPEFPGGGIGNVEVEREVLVRLTWTR